VIDEEGNMLGKIVKVDREKNLLFFKGKKKKMQEKERKQFILRRGTLILTSKPQQA
jgi:hypothetical protein